MEDPMNPNPRFSPLPPGCLFFPSEEQIVTYYLNLKNNNGDLRGPAGSDFIKEIDLYRFEPFDLPETACFSFGREGKKKHWYCFSPAARVKRGKGEKRRAGGGFWKRSGLVKDIVGAGAQGVVVGTRKTFVFFLGDSPKTAVRTKWVMHEYALVDQKMASFVLCRVFAKYRHARKTSDLVLDSCGGEAVKTVRHFGIQCDATSGSLFSASETDKGGSVDYENHELRRLLTSSGRTSDVPPVAMQAAALAIVEGDFIELNDLLCPLRGID